MAQGFNLTIRDLKTSTTAIYRDLSPSDRLRFWIDNGLAVRARGPVERDFSVFHDRVRTSCPELYDQPLIQMALRQGDMESYREALRTYHQVGAWAQNGLSIFDLSPDLAAAFVLTEPPPVPEGGLKLPFDCFLIRLPEGILPVFTGEEQHWAEHLWVHQFISMHTVHGKVEWLRYMATWQGLQVWQDRFAGKPDSEVLEGSIFNRVLHGDPPVVPEDAVTADVMLRILRNFISWLHATDALAKVKPEQRHQKKKASKASRARQEAGGFPKVWMLGKDVKLAPELKRAARDVVLGSSRHAPKDWRVRVRYVVRGHFHDYWTGKGRTELVTKFVQPYLKGPEGADAWQHVYQAGKE